MKSRFTFALLAVGLLLCRGLAAQDAHADGKDGKEFDQRLKKIQTRASGFHRSLARWLSKQGMHEWALKQWDRAIELDEDAAKNKPERETWSNRPKKNLKELWAEVEKKLLAESSVKIGLAYATLGKWAAEKDLSKEADLAWSRAIEYAGDNAPAREALGHIKKNGGWVSPGLNRIVQLFEKYSCKENGVALAKGTPADEAVGVDLVGRRSAHVQLESDFLTTEQTIGCIRVGEEVHQVFCAVFGTPPGANRAVGKHLALKSAKHYSRVIDKLLRHEGYDKEALKKGGHAWLDSDLHALDVGGESPDLVREGVAHFGAEMLLWRHDSDFKPWLFEGIAFFFARRYGTSIGWHCTGSTSTTIGRDFGVRFNWRASTKACVRLGIDPQPRTFLRADWDGLNTERSLKVWSYIEFMAARYKGQCPSFVAAMKAEPKTSKEDEAIFKKVFSMSVTEFDTAWRRWVLRTY